MHRIKIRQLEMLMVFMRTGSVTEAAEVLNTTQPNASKALKQIEETIGISLFSRVGGRLKPTPEAEILYGYVSRLMDSVDFIERLSLDLANLKSGFVKVACLSTFGTALMPLAVAQFNKKHPKLPIQIDVVDSEKIQLLVRQEVYDFGIVHYPEQEDELHSEMLGQGELVCLMHKSNPLASLPSLSIQDLAGVDLISYPSTVAFGMAVRRSFENQNVHFSSLISANHSVVLSKLVEYNHGVAILDEFSLWNQSSIGELVIKRLLPAIPVSVGLIASNHRPLSRAAVAFVDELRQVIGADSRSATAVSG
jgi:DNA-binding transcriptional LysR family regulator